MAHDFYKSKEGVEEYKKLGLSCDDELWDRQYGVLETNQNDSSKGSKNRFIFFLLRSKSFNSQK
jgi:hypothetical protein